MPCSKALSSAAAATFDRGIERFLRQLRTGVDDAFLDMMPPRVVDLFHCSPVSAVAAVCRQWRR